MIASLGLISNSTAVVIGAMIVAPLMDPILSLAFGLAVSDGKLIRRSAVTIGFGVLAVIGTAALISLGLGISHVQSEITGLTLGSEMVAVFGRGTVAGLTNQIAEGSFLLFLANLIGITVTSLVVFLLQRYGSLVPCLGLRIQLKSLQCSHSELFSWLVGRPKIKLNSRQRWWPTKWPSAIPA